MILKLTYLCILYSLFRLGPLPVIIFELFQYFLFLNFYFFIIICYIYLPNSLSDKTTNGTTSGLYPCGYILIAFFNKPMAFGLSNFNYNGPQLSPRAIKFEI